MQAMIWNVVLGPAGVWGVKHPGSERFQGCGTRSRAMRLAITAAREHQNSMGGFAAIRAQRPDGTWERERPYSDFATDAPTPIPVLAAAG
ncbi:hypothetical protein [Coralloluteibacterium thermophilus]|uniref:DUF2188 domain-containing protein n=1 Tax=Coralloluteibacterium thermophilum TaxID=2707049 RepID=A0ABV9NLN3_9GAMM